MFYFLKKIDWPLFLAVLVLCVIGLLSIYSSSDGYLNFYKQLGFLGAGVILMFIFVFIDYRNIKDNSYLILILYSICLILLLGLFFLGSPVRGVRSWYKIGHFALAPTELVKIVLLFLLAKYFSKRHVEMYRFRHIVYSGLYVFLPALLIYMQPDLGSVLVLLFVWLGVLMISGIKTKHFFVLLLIALIILGSSWSFLLKDYQKERVISFLVPEYQPLEVGWSQRQAKIAIGNGGFWGKGFLKGTQTQNGFLSEPQTDFIFSAIAEELGYILILIICSLFLFIFYRIIRIALIAEDNFSRLFVAGFGIMVLAQFFINIGSNLGFLPVIGIPLPFVSYGGSFLIISFVSLGIIQNIKLNS